MKLAMLKANVTAPYHHACSVCEVVKVPTSAGSTGTIRPIDTMSISTVIMMNGIAAARCRDSVRPPCSCEVFERQRHHCLGRSGATEASRAVTTAVTRGLRRGALSSLARV